MMIMDAGVHVWRPEAPDRPWMPGRKAHLPEPLTYEKFSAMMKDAGVDHAILVPPSWEGDRVDYSLEAAQKYPNRFAVMGRFPIEKPSERAKLETWRDQKGMLGVRLTLHHEWDRGWMKDGTADWFWPAAERLGIPVMLNAPYTHKEIGKVAERHSGIELRAFLDRELPDWLATVDPVNAPALKNAENLSAREYLSRIQHGYRRQLSRRTDRISRAATIGRANSRQRGRRSPAGRVPAEAQCGSRPVRDPGRKLHGALSL